MVSGSCIAATDERMVCRRSEDSPLEKPFMANGYFNLTLFFFKRELQLAPRQARA